MQILAPFLNKIFGDPNDKILKDLQQTVDAVNGFEETVSNLSDAELKQKTNSFKEQLSQGKTLDDILPEAFAVVREASKRVLNMRHFDVQIIGGLVLHQGRIAEMKTGEGKTLVATLPAYLNALSGQGVYMVTVNDYLAKRDSEWMGQIYTFLGLTVGLIQADMHPDKRKEAYAADITFGTNNEYGFDYLRDNLASSIEECCQLRRHFAIVDEVDSILIDEARTPLIISGPVPDSTEKYVKLVKVVKKLKEGSDFTLEEKHKNAILTEEGIENLEKALGISNIYSPQHMDFAHMAVQCLKAMYLFKKDVDYVVKEGQVQIVDEFTGRILDGRRYSDGLHQAIEACENLAIQEESQTLASVTYQNYFRLFPKLAGMTGTAITEEEEFIKIYGLDVVVIPTNKPIARKDAADVIYKSKLEKAKAIVKEIAERNKKGQPILVGTISIEGSEYLSQMLRKEGVVHNVLNAKHHEKEAEIITNAGQKSAVTIATNMAGRGTDIVLGEGVLELGGLYVIGSERHESRRIDHQLRGRSGRQGDAGETRFYVSLEDDLMRLFGSDRIARVMETLGLPDDTPIEHGMISKSIERAQKKVEQHHFSIRKQILEYDDVMDKQRDTVYTLRRDILMKKNLPEKLEDAVDETSQTLLQYYGFDAATKPQDRDPDQQKELVTVLEDIFPIKDLAEFVQKAGNDNTLVTELPKVLKDVLAEKAASHPKEIFEEVSKMVLLRALDSKWMDHLHNMDVLREGIGLRAYGQKNPLMEYKIEAFEMFKDLLFTVYEEALKVLLRVEIVATDNQGVPISQPLTDLSQAQLSGTEADPMIGPSLPNQFGPMPDPSPQVMQQASEDPSPPNQAADFDPSKLGRNDKVTIEKDGEVQELKWKKAESLLKEGWRLKQP